jgi:phage baseplate assembly protein W
MAEFYDIDFSFSLNANGDIKLVEDNSAILQSMKNIILTPIGQKSGSGDINTIFGVGTKQYIFAPLTLFTARSLGESILRNLTMFEPRISINDIQVDIDEQKRLFEINIFYVIEKTDEEFSYQTSVRQL